MQGDNLVPIEFEINIELPDKYVRTLVRNTLLTDPTWMLSMFAGYSFTFGPSIQLPPGIQFGPGAGGTLTVTTVTRPDQGRYRMSLNVFINNMTKRTNFTGYSGVLKQTGDKKIKR